MKHLSAHDVLLHPLPIQCTSMFYLRDGWLFSFAREEGEITQMGLSTQQHTREECRVDLCWLLNKLMANPSC